MSCEQIVPQLRQLEYLVALADTLHFRRAAERTNTTQPTLSGQLKALEDRLQVQLVERRTGKVVLTPAGQQITAIARRMLSGANEIRTLAALASKDMSGLLRLGLPPTIGAYLLQHVVPKLHKDHPSLKLYVREELPERLPRLLEDGVFDVVITPLPCGGSEFDEHILFEEPLHLTVAADHPLADLKSVRLKDLQGLDVLALGPGHQLHAAVEALAEDAGARMRYEFEGTSVDMLREMVIMGLGITFMPGLFVQSELMRDPNVKVLHLEDRALSRTIGMVWRKTSARRPTYQQLAAFIGKCLPGFEAASAKMPAGCES